MSDPSPVCEVKNGAAAYAATANGVDITPGETIIIRLASQADVDTWSIRCITTDDTSDADTVTAALSIDATNKTATLTAPAAGKAYRFQSIVNSGKNRNNVRDDSLTTTFCLYTLTTGGRRVIAADETTEGHSTFGWIKWLNDMIRDFDTVVGGGGGSAVGINNQFQYYQGGSFAGATGMNYNPTTMRADARLNVASIVSAAIGQATIATGSDLIAPKLLAPVIGGTMVFTGLDVKSVGLTDHQPIQATRVLSTSDATVTPIFAWKIADEAVTQVVVEMNAVPSGGAAGGSYARRVMIRSDGGVATCGTLESSWNDEHTASGIGFTGISVGSGIIIGASGATGFINVKGTPTGRIKWGANISVTPTSWA